MATFPSISSQAAVTCAVPGPLTRRWCQRLPGAAAASTASVPSPPSASGSSITSSSGRTRRQPAASAEAASAALMLPLNESGAATIRIPGAEIGREMQGSPDGLLDLDLVGSGIDGNDVFLALKDVEHRVGLVVVLAQPDAQRRLGIVLALDQLPAAGVALAFLIGAVVDQVVVHPAAGAEPTSHHPTPHFAVGQLEVNDAVNVVALQEELSLPPIARETVDDE